MICEDCANGNHNVCQNCPCQHVVVTFGGVPVSEILAAEAEEAEEGLLKRTWNDAKRTLSAHWQALNRPTTRRDWLDGWR